MSLSGSLRLATRRLPLVTLTRSVSVSAVRPASHTTDSPPPKQSFPLEDYSTQPTDSGAYVMSTPPLKIQYPEWFRKWFFNTSQYPRYGLYYHDTLREDRIDIKEAVARLPPQIQVRD